MKRSRRVRALVPTRSVHVECDSAAEYRWIRCNARGAHIAPDGSFAVFDESEWSLSLRAARATELTGWSHWT